MAAKKSRKASAKSAQRRIAPGVRAEVERRIQAGVSYRELAEHFGLADRSVRIIAQRMRESAPEAEAPAAAPASATDAPAPSAAAVSASVAAGDLSPEAGLARVESMIAALQATADLAKEDRNYRAAAQAQKEAAHLLPLLDRLRKACEASAGDAVTIPRALIAERMHEIYARADVYASVELCPHCGRELRMAAVGAKEE